MAQAMAILSNSAAPDAAAVVGTQHPSSQTDDSGTFSIATWNILSGRGGGLESSCRALEVANVDIVVLQETKLTDGIYTRYLSGYRIVASNAQSKQQGGVALLAREHEAYEL